MTISNLYSRIKKPLFYLSFTLALACTGGGEDGIYGGFFQPETSIKGPAFYDYHFSPSFLYGTAQWYDNFYADSVKNLFDDNLESWLVYIGRNYTVQEAGQAIYRSNLSAYTDKPAEQPLADAFLKAIKKHPSAMKYLEFAWKVESVQRHLGTWYDEPSGNNSDSLKILLPVALKMARSEKDSFLKDRYAFQAIKINGELRNFDDEIKLYDEFFGKKTSHSAIQYWAECRMGGAYLIQGDTAKAIYHFAQVFENCPSKRFAAYMSLRLNNVKFIPEAVNYCKSGKEKAAVYALCGVQPWQESIELLRGMLANDPSDSLMRLVFARELNKVEYDKNYSEPNDHELNDLDTFRIARQKRSVTNAKQLKEFAALAAANPHVPNNAFWLTAEAHSAFLLEDFTGSQDILALAEKADTKDSLLEDQITLQKFLLFSELTKVMTPEKEDEVLPMLLRFSDQSVMQHTNAFGYAAAKIEDLYKHQLPKVIKGSMFGCNSNTPVASHLGLQYIEAKIFLFDLLAKGHYRAVNAVVDSQGRRIYSDLDLIGYTTSSKTVQSVIDYLKAPDLRDFDKSLQKLSFVTVHPLYRLLGTRALIEQKYNIAAEAFSHIDTAIWNDEPYKTYLAANPFWTGILDTHAEVPADTIRYTPLTYAKKMAELSSKAQTSGSAEDYFALGCGSYNMSSWGNSWLLVNSYWTGNDEMGEYYWYVPPYPIDSTYYLAIVQAEKYFDEAGKRSKDKEFAARAYFMAAKCEQKLFYYYRRQQYLNRAKAESKKYFNQDDAFDSALFVDQKKLYRQYFNKLNNDYADTKFIEEARTECAFYDRYAKGE
jgi:hypothetical protein